MATNFKSTLHTTAAAWRALIVLQTTGKISHIQREVFIAAFGCGHVWATFGQSTSMDTFTIDERIGKFFPDTWCKNLGRSRCLSIVLLGREQEQSLQVRFSSRFSYHTLSGFCSSFVAKCLDSKYLRHHL